jgi:uncharacterized protein YaiI (UPF0178 family)
MIGARLALVVGVLVAGSAAARADEMDGWCAQVKKASSIVICSDAELRQQAIARTALIAGQGGAERCETRFPTDPQNS